MREIIKNVELRLKCTRVSFVAWFIFVCRWLSGLSQQEFRRIWKEIYSNISRDPLLLVFMILILSSVCFALLMSLCMDFVGERRIPFENLFRHPILILSNAGHISGTRSFHRKVVFPVIKMIMIIRYVGPRITCVWNVRFGSSLSCCVSFHASTHTYKKLHLFCERGFTLRKTIIRNTEKSITKFIHTLKVNFIGTYYEVHGNGSVSVAGILITTLWN